MEFCHHLTILFVVFFFVSCSRGNPENNHKRLKNDHTWKAVLKEGSGRLGFNTITIEGSGKAHYQKRVVVNHKPSEYQNFYFIVSSQETKKIFEWLNSLRSLRGEYRSFFDFQDGVQWSLEVYEEDQLLRTHEFDNKFPSKIKRFSKYLNSVVLKYVN